MAKNLIYGAAVLLASCSLALAQVSPTVLALTTTLDPGKHASGPIVMSGAGSARTFTLPDASGSGFTFSLYVGAVNTSNYVIRVADAGDTMDGSILMLQDAADTVVGWETAAASDTITLNGTTTGGVSIGDFVVLVDCADEQWCVRGTVTGSGTEATPFSAAVS